MPIEEVPAAQPFNEGGNTFGEGMDRNAIQYRRADDYVKPQIVDRHDDLHDSALYKDGKIAAQEIRDYSHAGVEEAKGLFGKIGSWFTQKTDEVKDSRLGTNVDRAGSGIEARVSEGKANLQRKAELASEKPDDSFITKIEHKAEEAKLYGKEKMEGLKADFRKEQIKDDLGLNNNTNKLEDKSASSSISSFFHLGSNDKQQSQDGLQQRIDEAQHIVETPDTKLMDRLRHRVVDGKQMHPQHIESMLGSGISTDKISTNPSTYSTTSSSDSITDTSNMVSGLDLSGVHAATRDTLRAQNQAERDLFHGRGNIMTSGPETGVRFDAAELPKFGTLSKTQDKMLSEANDNRSDYNQFRFDPRLEHLGDVRGEVDGLHAFRTEDF